MVCEQRILLGVFLWEKEMEHSFCIEDATNLSIEKAIILKNLRFWLDKNKANRKNAADGHYWTYNSSKAFAELFPYMKEKSISRWLKELEEDGLIKSGSYNKSAYDRTKWYTIPAEYAISQNEESIPQNEKTKDQNEKSIPQNEEPIPDINTDNKTYSKPDTLGEGRKPKNLEQAIDFFDDQLNVFNARPHAEKFYYHFEANGWTQGKAGKPLKKWGAAARNWKKNQSEWGKPLPEKPKKADKLKPATESCKKVASKAIESMKGLGL